MTLLFIYLIVPFYPQYRNKEGAPKLFRCVSESRDRLASQTDVLPSSPHQQPREEAQWTWEAKNQQKKKKSLLLLQLPDGEKEPSRCQKEIIRWQPVMLVKINKHQLFDPLQGRHGRRGVTSHPSALHKQQGNIWFWGIINFLPFGGKEEWLRVGVSWKRCSSTFAYLHIFPWIPL